MGIYRESALDNLSSPEQLDKLVKITSPKSWLILVFCTIVIVSVFIWGIVGSVPKKLHAQGILLSSKGTGGIISDVEGRVSDISINNDSYVYPGDVIARVYRDELVSQISILEQDIAIVKSYDIKRDDPEADKLPAVLLDLFKIKNEYSIAVSQNQSDVASNLLPVFDASKSALLDSLQKQSLQLKEELQKSSVISQIEGKVVAVNVDSGDIIKRGEEIARVIEKGSTVSDSEVVFYMPIEQGRQVSPGMEVNVYPTTVNRQEYGHMAAVVTSVSGYAISAEQIRRNLGNDELTDKFLDLGVVVEIRADLIKDSSTASGFYWSSRKGKDVELLEGTLCDASIKIDESRPLSLIIPNEW